MSKETGLKISWYVLSAAMFILTVLFFLDIKFVVVGINILVLDALTAGVWIFARLCKWAGCKNTGKRTLAVIALTFVGLLAVFSLFISGGYIEGTEPQTRRTFVVEYQGNMFNNGSAKLYERFGPLLFACDVEEYEGEFLHARPEERRIYISEDGKKIVVAFFFLHPVFFVPLEQPVQAEKTPEQVLAEQPIDDTHDAFLVDTGGELGTLLITAKLAEQSKNEFGTRDITFTVWNPAEMGQPIQTFTEEFMMGVAPEFHRVVDANFDGFQDFGYLFHAGNQPNYWHYWLWDEEQTQFIYYAPLIEVSQPVFNAERQIVTGYARGSAAGGDHSFYRWVDGELVLVREVTLYFDQKIVVKDLVDGQMTEVYRKEWEGEPESYDALYKWFDLDYHGEPGGIYDIFMQQPVDDTHDAFLVSTGGKLGTLLVTAELAVESKGEFGTRDITFTVWNPAEMEQPIQTFTEEFMMGVAPEFHRVVDANFDGFQDFGYLFFLGNQPNYCHYWLWDEEYGQFKYCAPLAEISQAEFDPEQQVVTGWARSSGAGDGITTFHRWEDGELVCVRRIESYCPWERATTVSVKDRIDGELQQVYYEEFPWLGGEPEGREAWRQAVYVWRDLDYHGELTEENS